MITESIQRYSSFNIIHRETFFKVDVFIPRPRPFLQSQLIRAQRQTFTFETEVSAKFASPEDTILAKLEWYRWGGEVSDRQWRDILGVLKTRSGELDLGYVRKWAEELHVKRFAGTGARRINLTQPTGHVPRSPAHGHRTGGRCGHALSLFYPYHLQPVTSQVTLLLCDQELQT